MFIKSGIPQPDLGIQSPLPSSREWWCPVHHVSAIKNLSQTTQFRLEEEWDMVSTLRRGSFSRRRPDPVEGRFSLIPLDHGHQVANIDDEAARSLRCRNSFTSDISGFESTSFILRKKSKNIGISARCADRIFDDEKQELLGSEAISEC